MMRNQGCHERGLRLSVVAPLATAWHHLPARARSAAGAPARVGQPQTFPSKEET